jgi:hypothetical protein
MNKEMNYLTPIVGTREISAVHLNPGLTRSGLENFSAKSVGSRIHVVIVFFGVFYFLHY